MLVRLGVCLVLFVVAFYGQPLIGTFAGGDYQPVVNGMRALDVPLGFRIRGLAQDAQGRILISDPGNHVVFRVETNGNIRILEGTGVRGNAPGQLNSPTGLAFDSTGTLYIFDSGNSRILSIAPTGARTTIASAYSGSFMAVDRINQVYFSSGDRIWRWTRAGGVAPFAGTGDSGFSGDGGPALSARLSKPAGIAFDRDDNMYVADSGNRRIRKIAPSGTITTFVSGLGSPEGITLDARDNLYLADSSASRIRVVSKGGEMRDFAGDPAKAFTNSGDGGRASDAGIGLPSAVQFDSFGNFYFTDIAHDRVRRIDSTGRIFRFAGNGLYRHTPDGSIASSAILGSPMGVALDAAGNIFVTEAESRRVRRLNANSTVTAVAGVGGYKVGPPAGPALESQIGVPRSGATDSRGNYYFSADDDRVYRLTSAGQLTVFAGTAGQTGFSGDGARADRALLNSPEGIAADAEDNVYIADSGNDRIRKVDKSGVITTVPASTEDPLVSPFDVAFDKEGRLHVCDRTHRVRRVGTGGSLVLVAGQGRPGFEGDGRLAPAARFDTPRAIAFDGLGNLYVADTGNQRVRIINTEGVITTLAGNGTEGFSGDGEEAARAQMARPIDVAADSIGRVYIADQLNNRIRVVLPQAPTFEPSVTRLAFSGTSTTGETAPQSVRVTGSSPGLAFNVTASTNRGGEWLRVMPPVGTIPQTFQVIADTSNLIPNFYTGTVTIRTPLARPQVRTIPVEFSVGEAPPPRLAASTNAIRFSVRQRQNAVSQTILVSNVGGGEIQLSTQTLTSNGGDWLAAAAPANSIRPGAPGAIRITANPLTLPVGTYRGQVLLSDPGGVQLTIQVTMAVARADQSILLSQTGLSFVAVEDGSAGPPDQLGVLNSGVGFMDWSTVTSTFNSPRQWLSVDRNAGRSDSDSLQIPLVNVSVTPTGLRPGRYYGSIRVASRTARNSPQDVTVVLTVLPKGSNPGPVVRPSGIILTGEEGTVPSTSQQLSISNLTAAATRFASARLTLDGANWFRSQPESSPLDPFQNANVVVQPEFSRLTAGIRRGALTFLFPDGVSRAVNVLSVVIKAQPNAAKEEGTRSAEGQCSPTRLVPVFRRPGPDFSVRGGNPVAVEAQILDDCGNSFREGSVTVSFSDNSPAVVLTSLGDGRWSGTWSPRGIAGTAVFARLSAASEEGLSGQEQLRGALLDRDAAPELAPDGLVNAASLIAGSPAPGSIVKIGGTNLADDAATAPAGPVPIQLRGVSVTIAARELPLLQVSEKEITAIVPYGIETNTRHQVIVRRGDAISTPEDISLVDAQPGLVSRDGTGKGPGEIADASGKPIDASNPAKAGDTVHIVCTGLGEVAPGAVAGVEAPAGTPPEVVSPVSVTVGGKPATVSSAVLAPGLIGLYRVTAIVPDGIPAGGAVPVTVSAAGQTSNAVTMAVQ